MALKRKRSSPVFSSPASDTSDAPPPQSNPMSFFYHHSKPVEPTSIKAMWSWPTYEDSPAHLNSRTRKRHRSRTRKEEEQAQANTLNRLYEAQRRHPDASPVLSQPVMVASESHPQRSTLHSFWNLGQPPVSVPMAVDHLPSGRTQGKNSRCEDCERSIRPDDAMELDDSVVEEETRCQDCRRQVCDMCAVLRDHRVCLGCASSH